MTRRGPRAASTSRCGAPTAAILVTGPTGSGKTTSLYADHRAGPVAGEDADDDRGPGRVPPRRRRPDPGRRADRTDVRDRAARDRPRRPRRDHGRRDPRPRERPHRRRRRADRPPRPLDAAHQRRSERADATRRHGHRALSRRLGGQLRGRAAACAASSARPAGARCWCPPSTSVCSRRRGRRSSRRVGCPRCRHTGYRGRVGLFEVMNVTDEIRSLIVSRALRARDRPARRPAGHDAASAKTAWPRSAPARRRSPSSDASSADPRQAGCRPWPCAGRAGTAGVRAWRGPHTEPGGGDPCTSGAAGAMGVAWLVWMTR